MNENWKYLKLKEVATVIDPHPSHRAPKAVETGIAFAGIGDIDEFGNIEYKKARIVSPEILEEQKSSYDLNEDSIGYGRVGTVGKIIYFGKQERDFTLSPTMAIINPNVRIVPEFLKAYLPTYDFWSQVNAKIINSFNYAHIDGNNIAGGIVGSIQGNSTTEAISLSNMERIPLQDSQHRWH